MLAGAGAGLLLPGSAEALWSGARRAAILDKGGGGPTYTAEATALFAAMTTQPDVARKTIIDTLIISLKSSAVWTDLDFLYLTAAHTSQAGRLNWINPGTFTASASNSPSFATDRGFLGDGASARLNTGFSPATHGVNFTVGACHLGVWLQSAGLGGFTSDLGAEEHFLGGRSATQADVMLGNNNATRAIESPGTQHLVVRRASSSQVELYRNAVESSEGDFDPGGNGTLPALDVTLLTRHTAASTWWAHSSNRISAAHGGGQLSPSKITALYSALNTYMQAIGAA